MGRPITAGRTIVLLISSSLWFSITQQAAFGDVARTESGKKVYEQHCVLCHGPSGKGNGPLAAELHTKPADLTSQKVRRSPDGQLLSSIRDGKPGTAMPAWKNDLHEEQILDVLAYVRSLSP